ncbi:MAG: 4-hydroxy-tetrahydrodipicolinate synthase [Corynebacterium sp.]|nr:4-hydroxy-tetrahydrodipicolinate synthase [Corynebacterium sp.]
MSTGMTARTGVETFGRVGVAMVTPFDHDGNLDVAAARSLATHLVDSGIDSIIVSGTTGESPTTTVEEKLELLKAVKDEVGDRAKICAGAGTNNTRASVELARLYAEVGADSLLIVTPYYSKPSQAGVYQHFAAIANATDLPICVYDIPGRSGIPIASDTLRKLAELPTIAAVKDAKGNLAESALLMKETGLAWYSGDDTLNLPWLSLGASGFISVVGHLAPQALAQLWEAFDEGDIKRAQKINVETLLPLTQAQERLGGVTLSKEALRLQGINVGDPRLPITGCDDKQREELRNDLEKAGVL